MSSSKFATSGREKSSPSSSPSPIEENLNLPDYAQNVLQDVDLPVLILISHRHAPPLNPRPQLRFDVRSLPNPPKHIRDALNGTSWRLQEWMLSDAMFGERRDAIRKEIEEEMTRMTAEHEKIDVLNLGQDAKWEPNEVPRETPEEEALSDEEQEEDYTIPNEADSSSGESDQDASALRVGIFCAMGRHRSVAMVEVLAQMSWPGWQVEVQHRDVFKKRDSGKKSGGKQSRGTRGGVIPSHFEDD
ncbi:hypothetical protein DL98DRAFT_509850 [Cadophora sp. DSE1049]|nr:hypothetical protein DL98DRAFT_509850 [Cadophora sp. DSE1049]